MKKRIMSIILIGLLLTASVVSVNAGVGPGEKQENHVFNSSRIDLPSQFDLRNVSGKNYVTIVKNQSIFGTCWAFGALASMEGNLLMTGNWNASGEEGEPDLSEAHLVWWSGFSWCSNDDDPGYGLSALFGGGDYRMVSAYLSRGEGAVREKDAPYTYAPYHSFSYNSQQYRCIPPRYLTTYHHYYARDIEWYVAEEDLSNINTIKYKIMTEGAIGTCNVVGGGYGGCFNDTEGNKYIAYYQPPNTTTEPNHAVAIVGWDDDKFTNASLNDPSKKGAWLCKTSWGDWEHEHGYYWISYYDKWCCQHPKMGAVSFQDVEYQPYENIYYHDFHGWRDTMTDVFDVFNAFTAERKESLEAVSFYTAADDVDYTVRIFDRFEDGELKNIRSSISGTLDYTGFHTIDLDTPVELNKGDDFYINLKLSDGGYPIDRTSEVEALLGSRGITTIIKSSAERGESYYRSLLGNPSWHDLYDYEFTNSTWDGTANFCIKGLSANLDSGTVESDVTFTESCQNIEQQSLPSGSPTNN